MQSFLLFLGKKGIGMPIIRLSAAKKELIDLVVFFFSQKKKQKALFRFVEGLLTQTSAKPTQGVWGRAPRNQSIE
jgi:uncharacterized metal-binding protein